MSGSIGADRIQKSAVERTVDWFKENVLQHFEGYKSAVISGSFNSNKSKKDYGDVDLVVQVDAQDLKEVRKQFQDYIESLPDNITVPFKAGKHKGEKSQLYGTVVTCQVPIQGFEGLTVQVDCNFALTEKEQEFQKNFLDLPAEKQALLMGLVRVILMEEEPDKIFKRLHITKLPDLEANQEFEFVLSSQGLTLRKVTLEDFKEVDRKDIWRSKDWSNVEALLRGYGINQDFDGLLGEISSKLKKARSKRRLLGIVQSTINVSEGEKGTAKGDVKERAIEKAEDKLAVGIVQDVEPKNVVALYAGGFKPAHRGHFSNAEKLAKRADRLIIFIGPKVREGVPITAEQAKQVWEVYSKYLNIPVEIRVSKESPVSDIYKIIGDKDYRDLKFIIGVNDTKDDKRKFEYLTKNKSEYPNTDLVTLPLVTTVDDEKLSASTLRQSIDLLKRGNWIPKDLDRDDARKVLDILLKPLSQEIVKEETERVITSTLMNIKEGSSGTHIMPTTVISSENREKLGKLYDVLEQNYGDQFDIRFNQSFIQIKVKWPGEIENGRNGFDYEMSQAQQFAEGQEPELGDPDKAYWVRHMAGLIEFLKNKNLKLDPLPEIILKRVPQSQGLLDKTGSYDKNNNVIEIYTAGRHPRDIMRSAIHELYHVHQAHNGQISNISTEQVTKDENLRNIEGECFRESNLLFREWLESLGDYQK